jgi:uncharacterized membrane protein
MINLFSRGQYKMTKNNQSWLEREIAEWTSKGWITAEGQKHIRSKMSGTQPKKMKVSLPLYAVCSIIGLALLVVAAIWAVAYGWYHVDVYIKMAISVLLLIISQAGICVSIFQERQGSFMGEGIGLFHCAAVFISLALVEQAFYTGWHISSYLLICSLFVLPAAYLLQSLCTIIAYLAIILFWGTTPGAVNVWGGTSLIWLLVLIAAPAMLFLKQSPRRLEIFCWAYIATIFGAFWIAVQGIEYVPLLLFSLLAGMVFLAGYALTSKESWGRPLRWLGRIALAGALLGACISINWIRLTRIESVHWLTGVAALAGVLVLVYLYVKWLRKRLWSPTVYMVIPVVLIAEAFFSRSAMQPSFMTSLSAVCLCALGIFEIAKGLRDSSFYHLDWGIILFFALGAVQFIGSGLSYIVFLVAVVILGLALLQLNRYVRSRQAAELRKSGRNNRRAHQTVTAVRRERHVPVTAPSEEAEQKRPEWLQTEVEKSDFVPPVEKKQVHVAPSVMPSTNQPNEKIAPAPQSSVQQTVVPKPVRLPSFEPPVFNRPEVTLPFHRQEAGPSRRKTEQPQRTQERVTKSPWAATTPTDKREKHFTRSPWAKEEGNKK